MRFGIRPSPTARSVSPRKLAIHLRLQKFPGQTYQPEARCRRKALHARSMGSRDLLERPTNRQNPLHPNSKCTFQLEQVCPLLSHEERRSNATLAGSSRAANTMNERFGYLRKVIVNDMGDVLYVNAAGGHIGRDEHAVLPSLKSGQCCSSLGLRTVPVDHRRIDSLAVEALSNSLCAAFSSREDQAA